MPAATNERRERSGSEGSLSSLENRSYTPVVASMLQANTLRDCRQVEDMYTHCAQHSSSSYMCKTATRYYDLCVKRGGEI